MDIYHTNVPAAAIPSLLAAFEGLQAQPDSIETKTFLGTLGTETMSIGYAKRPGRPLSQHVIQLTLAQLSGAIRLWKVMNRIA